MTDQHVQDPGFRRSMPITNRKSSVTLHSRAPATITMANIKFLILIHFILLSVLFCKLLQKTTDSSSSPTVLYLLRNLPFEPTMLELITLLEPDPPMVPS